MNTRVVKMIGTKEFVLSLYEADSGRYYVGMEVGDKIIVSESMIDFKMASFLFDIKLSELQKEHLS